MPWKSTSLMTDYYLQTAGKITPLLSYKENEPFEEQKQAAKAKLIELLKMPEKQTKPHPVIEWTDNSDPLFDEIRFRFESEPGFWVPAHILFPKVLAQRHPVMICLQGHTKGMFVSIGRTSIACKERGVVEGDRDFAIQAVRHGFAAVVMEQRGFGELNTDMFPERRCMMPSVQALSIGHTLLGERIFDITQLIDTLAFFDKLDLNCITMLGNSGGGTAIYYSMCVDERIHAGMPSCFFGKFLTSFFGYPHCSCGFIPDFFRWFDLPDLAIAIAPRPLLIVAGEKDPLSDIEDVRISFYTKVKAIYAASGKPNACQLVIGSEGHRFYANQAWPIFEKLLSENNLK